MVSHFADLGMLVDLVRVCACPLARYRINSYKTNQAVA
jgi:hypothetical protein